MNNEKRKSLVSMPERRDDWSTREVRVLIGEKFGVEYSMKHVREMLRQMGIKFMKAY
ncbi:winged helix-turn-helix domain-containing protein [Metallosphaera sp.]|uniref:winged helix-turn-helix domain-containing protein n=1 Tax=Metallosphaera sp. TaxID=2020860 RepID=UPI00317AACE8